MRKRTIKVHYAIDGNLEWAVIETAKGYYVAEVHRCHREGQRRFRQRVRSLQQVIESYPGPIVFVGGDEA